LAIELRSLTRAQRTEASPQANPLAAAETFRARFTDFQRAQVTALVERIYRELNPDGAYLERVRKAAF
jgi:hypothetical protein